jgi:hypothetical protein
LNGQCKAAPARGVEPRHHALGMAAQGALLHAPGDQGDTIVSTQIPKFSVKTTASGSFLTAIRFS